MAQQLTFDLPVRTTLERDDFFVSPANAVAVAEIDDWQAWPGQTLILTGPKSSGKSHLTHVWAADAGAKVVPAKDLETGQISNLVATTPNIAVEDVELIAGNALGEQALFHLFNLALSEGGNLLMTGLTPPATWPITLPDLKSRLQGCNLAHLSPPDDALLSAVVFKLFADRQIDVQPGTINYLIKRMERSFDCAAKLVEALDEMALSERRAITRNMAARVLDNASSGGA